jgi:SAM-dependent methyltransferase
VGFFDFLRQTSRYADKASGVRRLELRHRFIVEPFAADLKDARVLDLAAQDGRWTYALAQAGAREVLGVEVRPELIEQYAEYPDDEVKSRTKLVQGDVFEAVPRLADAGETFDVVAIYGLYYHVMDHYRLLREVVGLKPSLIIIDSDFSRAKRPLIDIYREDPEKYFNSVAHIEGQTLAPVGLASRSAVEMMAISLGYRTEWADWASLPESERQGVRDYFDAPNKPRKVRDTCALRPVG